MEYAVQIIRNADGTMDVLSHRVDCTVYFPGIAAGEEIDLAQYGDVSFLELIVSALDRLFSRLQKLKEALS